MPVPLEKIWQTEGNILIDEESNAACARRTLWTLKALLIGDISADGAGGTISGANGKTGLWTVYGSCDSSSAGLDGIDRWGSGFDPNKIVNGSTSAARSWIVLKSPDDLGPYYLILDYGANSNQLRMHLSKSAPTGGSTLSAPTYTDGWQNNIAAGGNFISNAPNARVNLILSDDGSFWFTISRGGAYEGVLGVQRCIRRTGDNYPVVSCHAYSTSNGGPFGAYYQSPLYINSTGARAFKGKSLTNIVTEMYVVVPTAHGTSANLHLFGGNNTTQFNGAGVDGAYDEMPVFLFCPLANNGGLRRIPDIYLVGGACPEGSVAVDDDGKLYASCVSDVWLPWTASYLPIV